MGGRGRPSGARRGLSAHADAAPPPLCDRRRAYLRHRGDGRAVCPAVAGGRPTGTGDGPALRHHRGAVGQHRPRLCDAWRRRQLAGRGTAEWRAALDAADVPNRPSSPPRRPVRRPYLAETGFFRRIPAAPPKGAPEGAPADSAEDATADSVGTARAMPAGMLVTTAPPVAYAATPAGIRHPPPVLGADTGPGAARGGLPGGCRCRPGLARPRRLSAMASAGRRDVLSKT